MKRIQGLRIASIRGVDIKLHISLVFILLYVVLVASARFPLVANEAGISQTSVVGGPFLWGVIFAVSLFVSVLLHELGHVFVAQSMGVRVQGITLMMLGGVSEMERMPEKRLQEFKVSIIGPMVSFAIAGGLYFLEQSIEEANVILFSHWLGRVNLFLGIFNLLPAFPMDGGRVLRSILAVKLGNLRATQISVKVGKAFAWIFGTIGFLQFNILLLLIAVFLYMAASSELMMAIGENALKGLKAKDVARRIPPLREGLLLEYAAHEMLQSRNLVMPVQASEGESALLGIEAIRQIPPARRQELRVSDVMERADKVLEPDDSVDTALAEVAGSPLKALPYHEMGRLVGLVLFSDLSEILQLKSLDQGREEPRKDQGRAA